MIISLRDSKPLQAALLKRENARSGRNVLPRIQLHPDLLNGVVEAGREGFVIRSEQLTGDHQGDPNKIDVQNMEDFLPGPATCEASWKVVTLKQGDSFFRIPSELSFTFDDGRLVITTQAVADVAKLTSGLSSDQRARYDATYHDGVMTFVKSHGQKEIPVSSLSSADLQVEAAKLGVKWDKRASRETMLQKIEEAKKETVPA